MNAVEITEITDKIIWFTWAYGRRIGCSTLECDIELDVDGRPSMSFRYAIRDAYHRFKAKPDR